ncbi:MAG: anaerobic ribonucleoside-triphosphate reductase activating protein [Oscillospiraceae bacterium]|nr:anaerobic ribonucleoside-triphosphate reductase activating protein [Oscillospiraceae bacterium]
MLINGLQKLTLLDFPEHTACTVFTGGCNMRCPFCHNAVLVTSPESQPVIGEEKVFDLLDKRRGLLDGVAITGGEPTLMPDLADFIGRIKEKGFHVKLDTNGTRPEVLRELIENRLVDYVAMDIKSSKEGYPKAVGMTTFDLAPVEESAALLMQGGVEFEFRTTVVKELHDIQAIEEIGKWLSGAPKYFLQYFKDNGETIEKGLNPVTPEELRAFAKAAEPYFGRVGIRGVE